MDRVRKLRAKHKVISNRTTNLCKKGQTVKDIYHTSLWLMCGKHEKTFTNGSFTLRKGYLADNVNLREARLGVLDEREIDAIKEECNQEYEDMIEEVWGYLRDVPLYNFFRKSASVVCEYSDEKAMVYRINEDKIIIQSLDRNKLKNISSDKKLKDEMEKSGVLVRETMDKPTEKIDILSNDNVVEDIRSIEELQEKTIRKIDRVSSGLDNVREVLLDEFQDEMIACSI